jgi:hypothetical protein
LGPYLQPPHFLDGDHHRVADIVFILVLLGSLFVGIYVDLVGVPIITSLVNPIAVVNGLLLTIVSLRGQKRENHNGHDVATEKYKEIIERLCAVNGIIHRIDTIPQDLRKFKEAEEHPKVLAPLAPFAKRNNVRILPREYKIPSEAAYERGEENIYNF